MALQVSMFTVMFLVHVGGSRSPVLRMDDGRWTMDGSSIVYRLSSIVEKECSGDSSHSDRMAFAPAAGRRVQKAPWPTKSWSPARDDTNLIRALIGTQLRSCLSFAISG